MSSDQSPKKTICLGRYLMDLPVDSVVRASFKYATGILETRSNFSTSMFEKLINDREGLLKNSKHDGGGNMLVDRVNIDANKVILISWTGGLSRKVHMNESYVYFPKHRVIFLHKTDSSASAQAQNVEILTRIANSYQYREENEIPREIGFCINSGLIVSKLVSREEVSASIDFKKYPSVSFSFGSLVTGAPSKEGLLSRHNRGESQLPAAAKEIMTVLRKAKHNVGSVQAEEVLIRAVEDGKRSYFFSWKSEGIENSIEFPAMSIDLYTTHKKDNRNEIIDAPFKTDKEALEFWDELVNSLRLRPGAV